MSRFQLSLNVDDVDASVAFYTKLFGVGPAKHRTGYANFVVSDPPLKLVIVENEGEPGSINHVGIEFDSSREVAAQTERVAAAGLAVEVDDPHTCCFATQEKAWTQDLDGVPWELYTVLADASGFGASPRGGTPLDVMLPPIDLRELQAALDDDISVVIDAQGRGGYESAHLRGAIDFDLDTVEQQAAVHIGDSDRRVIVYCTDSDCLGAEYVGTLLVQAGYTNVARYSPGVAGWRDAGLPVVTGT
jgi:lactoylglutathione lyase